jgi:polyadenylate-binding protein
MFHGKPLYVTIAQRKEDRQAQLQLQYAQRMAGLAGHSTTIIPGGYPPYYYTTPSGVVSQVPPRPTMMYQHLGLRPGWGANGFAPPARPGFQPSPVPVVSTICLTTYKAFSHCIFVAFYLMSYFKLETSWRIKRM